MTLPVVLFGESPCVPFQRPGMLDGCGSVSDDQSPITTASLVLSSFCNRVWCSGGVVGMWLACGCDHWPAG